MRFGIPIYLHSKNPSEKTEIKIDIDYDAYPYHGICLGTE